MGSDLISGNLFFLYMWHLCTVLAALPWYSFNCWIGVKSQFHPPSDFLKPIYYISHPFTLHTRFLFRFLLFPPSYFLFYFIRFHGFFSHFLKIGPTSYCLFIIAGSSLECTYHWHLFEEGPCPTQNHKLTTWLYKILVSLTRNALPGLMSLNISVPWVLLIRVWKTSITVIPPSLSHSCVGVYSRGWEDQNDQMSIIVFKLLIFSNLLHAFVNKKSKTPKKTCVYLEVVYIY